MGINETFKAISDPIRRDILQTVILGYRLGWDMDIRKVAALVVGGVFLMQSLLSFMRLL